MKKKVIVDMGARLEELLTILMVGKRSEFKEAKKEIEKLWHADRKAFNKASRVVLEYLPRFDQIQTPENQVAFCSGLSSFYFTLGDDYFNELKDFTLKVLQHSHGSVREAIRKTAEWLFISLSSRVEPFAYRRKNKPKYKREATKIVATMQYRKFVRELEELIEQYDDNVRVDYIQEMKPSVCKSLQLYWSRLTEGYTYRKILEQSHVVPRQILIKRKEIEQDIARLLEVTKSDFGLEFIKTIIFDENGHDDLTGAISIFDTGIGQSELENILETLTDAWNYFPHRSLGGLSPAEKILEK
ncbi:MAG: hypothetical protein NUV85_00220 [Candidatus Berkelbacteria bacterium]|nr:hypothetical protein [Candidatus Berkelbacteria bacterium]